MIQKGVSAVSVVCTRLNKYTPLYRYSPPAQRLRRAHSRLETRGVWRHNRVRMETTPDSSALIEAVANKRDREAFGVLFDHFAPRIKTFMIRRGASDAVAEDLAQEALLIVWRKAATFDPARASASAWIFTIARNLRIDQFRRDQRAASNTHLDMVEPDEPARPDQIVVGQDNDDHVRSALKRLPAEQLRVIQLSFFEGKAHGEIAQALNIPLGTVKSRLRLAFTRLRDLLDELK